MRLGKFNIPLADIPKMVIRIAHDKGVNLNENFEITIQSSTNPELILTKSFHTLDQLTHFIVGSIDAGENKKSYGMENFKINGVMDFVKIINLHNLTGGCSNKGVKNRERTFNNHIYTFKVISQESRDNNCGIDVLRNILHFTESAEKSKKKYKIPTKIKMSFEQLNHIYNNEITDDRLPLVLLTKKSCGVLNKADYRYIFVSKDHYHNVEDIIPHNNNKKVKRGKLYWDCETRPTEECINIKSKNENREIIT